MSTQMNNIIYFFQAFVTYSSAASADNVGCIDAFGLVYINSAADF